MCSSDLEMLAAMVEQHPEAIEAGKINWTRVLMDSMMVLAAYYTKDPRIIYNAAANLMNGILRDLGVNFQIPPYPM